MSKTSTAHARIIWCCSWTHDDVCFATASRDKRVSVRLFMALVCCGGLVRVAGVFGGKRWPSGVSRVCWKEGRSVARDGRQLLVCSNWKTLSLLWILHPLLTREGNECGLFVD